MNLDSLGKEVPSLGRIFGSSKGRAQLGNNIGTRVEGLANKSKDSNHGKTTVLDLLDLLFRIFLRGVVDVEGVPTSWVPNANVAKDTVGSLFPDTDDTLVLEPSCASNNLEERRLGNGCDGFERVQLRVGINSAELIGSWEGSEEAGPDESDASELGNTTVGKFGLTEPLDVAHEVSLDVKGVVEGGQGLRGEANGIKTNISRERSVEGVWGGSEGKSLCSLNPVGAQGSGGFASLGRGKGGSRAGKKIDGGDPHDGCFGVVVKLELQ